MLSYILNSELVINYTKTFRGIMIDSLQNIFLWDVYPIKFYLVMATFFQISNNIGQDFDFNGVMFAKVCFMQL